jgi:hypothetical protein
MNLQEVKEKIRIESSDPETNKKFKGWITEPNDCFGQMYEEESQYCRDCTVLADVDGRKEQLFVFCRELVLGPVPEEQLDKDFEEPLGVTPEPVKEVVTEVAKKPTKGGGKMEKIRVKGAVDIARKSIKEGKALSDIITELLPLYTEKGLEEKVAKSRIREVYYACKEQLRKAPKEETPVAETPCCAEPK